MVWYEYLITTGVPTISIFYVGHILKQQIKSQKSIIDNYKGLVEATSPDKIIALHNQEVDVIQRLANNNIDNLKKQIFEMSNYLAQVMIGSENTAKSIGQPDFINLDAIINRLMPNAKATLDSMINYYRERQKNN